ncbi:hypothetical protein EDM22_03175 [Agromyces tardus]|uniref:Uncharacterized protein n=1 Tax=Agromyces tardus TaxID=2583849 RepID=A0A3M8AJQ8_9MICO|nr:PD40 domain-containing protein [Agromyces tardus]RNB51456.1 hypothetical protein EDM22_03175 [Agromyces tardus]
MHRVPATPVVLSALALGAALSGCAAAEERSAREDPSTTEEPTATFVPPTLTGSILFVDAGDIVAYRGDEAANLTTTPEAESVPRWSSDGSRIIFIRSDDAGNGDVYTMNADGSGEVRLTTTQVSEEVAAWSPDDSAIAFSTFTEADGGTIWLMNADGTEPRAIYAEQDAFVGLQDWAPDGRSLLIGVDRGGGGELDLYSIGVDGTGLAQLTATGGDDAGGRWAPDGQRIVFWSDGNPQGPGIYLMAPDGSDPQRILEDTLSADTVASAWSPDGDRIAWTAKFEGGGGSPIWVMTADGTGLEQLWDELPERSTLDWAE